MKYLAHYLYIAPFGTFMQGIEEQHILSLVFVTDSLNEAIDFIAENTDTLNYFEETLQPEILSEFSKGREGYHYDNTSDNGESFSIVCIQDGESKTSTLGMNH